MEITMRNGITTNPLPEAGAAGSLTQIWKAAGLATVTTLLLLLAGYWPTALSMPTTWLNSETFAHGILIVPISAYLIWRKRAILHHTLPVPDFWAALLLPVFGLGWLVAELVDVQLIQQLALIAMLLTTLWCLLGWQVIRLILFPLLFLFFAVPMGEELIPPLMDFTAFFTVKMLQLTGIPVYSDGTFFSIPSGDWSVIESCSGVRYFIASVTLGSLYAYLSYQSYWRRTVFILLSIGVPILANGLRAYMIVMLGHLSGMRLAVGVDHLIYGWVFFGIVMFLLFWIGFLWHEPETAKPAGPSPTPARDRQFRDPKGYGKAALLSLIMVGIWPIAAALQSLGETAEGQPVVLRTPAPAGGWNTDPALLTDWQPQFLGTDGTLHQSYRNADQKVGVFLAFYSGKRQGAELISSQNVMVSKEQKEDWKRQGQHPETVFFQGKEQEIQETIIQSSATKLLLWHWYWIGGEFTGNPILGKFLQAKAKLLLREPQSAGVVVYTPFGDRKQGRQQLQAFIDAMLPSLQRGLSETSLP